VIDSYGKLDTANQADLRLFVNSYNNIANEGEQLTLSTLDTDDKMLEMKDELKQKKQNILTTVSLKLNKTLNAIEPIIGNSISYKDRIDSSKEILNEVNKQLGLESSKPVKTKEDLSIKDQAQSFLKDLQFTLQDNLEPSEEVAYEILKPLLSSSKPTVLPR
jgi:hypothetical protein